MPSTNSTEMPGQRRLLDGDHALLADVVERLGDGLADPLVLLAGDRGDVAQVVAPRHRPRLPAQVLGDAALGGAPRCRGAAASGWRPRRSCSMPSRTIAWASSVAVVVPSPVRSLVLLATSRTSWAPMFLNGSESSISRAIETPSLVIVGAPVRRSSTTLRPLGPSVTLTASASSSTPACSRRRASWLKWRILPIRVPVSLGRRPGRGCPAPGAGRCRGRPSRR